MDFPKESFINYINSIIELNVPFKTVHKYKLRTPALQKSFFCQKLINQSIQKTLKQKYKDHQAKYHHNIKYKCYRNVLSTFEKKSKRNY